MRAKNPTTQADRRYILELSASMLAYVVALFGSIWLLTHGVRGVWVYPAALLPVLPVALVFAAVVRYLQHTDEFVRQTQVTSLAISGGVTALILVTYGFLENAGLPNPSVWVIFAIFMVGWAIARPFVRRYYQ